MGIVRLALFLWAIWFINGCGQSAYLVFTKDESKTEAIHYTQRGEVRDYFETLALMRATYLNPLDPAKYQGDEYFFVGLYIPDDFPDDNRSGIQNPLYRLSLNGDAPTAYRTLDESDILLKTMPMVTRWHHYYLVSFPAQEHNNTLILTLEKVNVQKGSVAFQKVNAK